MMRIDRIFMRDMLNRPPDAVDGGKGSGNWGHLGRLGKKGGSGKGTGGAKYRSGSKEEGFSRNEETRNYRTAQTQLSKMKSEGKFPTYIAGNPKNQAAGLKAVNEVFGKAPDSLLSSFGAKSKLDVQGNVVSLTTSNGVSRSYIPQGYENDPDVVEGAKTFALYNAYMKKFGKLPEMTETGAETPSGNKSPVWNEFESATKKANGGYSDDALDVLLTNEISDDDIKNGIFGAKLDDETADVIQMCRESVAYANGDYKGTGVSVAQKSSELIGNLVSSGKLTPEQGAYAYSYCNDYWLTNDEFDEMVESFGSNNFY